MDLNTAIPQKPSVCWRRWINIAWSTVSMTNDKSKSEKTRK